MVNTTEYNYWSQSLLGQDTCILSIYMLMKEYQQTNTGDAAAFYLSRLWENNRNLLVRHNPPHTVT